MPENKKKDSEKSKKIERKRRVLLVTLTPYDRFLRVQRMAKTLSRGGAEVHVLSSIEKEKNRINENDENIHRFYIPIIKRKESIGAYFLLYVVFFISVFIYGTYLHLKNRYDTIYVVNHPDILVLCLLIPKILGARILLDIRDPMIEIFHSKFGKNRVIDLVLRVEEKVSVMFSDKILTVSGILKRLICKRDAVVEEKVSVVYNTPYRDFGHHVSAEKPKKNHEKITVTYVGAIRKERGLENLIFSLEYLDDRYHLMLVGDGDYLPVLRRISLKYKDRVAMPGRIPHELIKKYLANSDVFVVQLKSSPINYIGTPGKLFEYMAYEKPVLVPEFPGIVNILGEDYPFFFNPDDPKDIARSIKDVFKIYYSDEKLRKEMIKMYRDIFYSLCWDMQENTVVRVFFRE